MRTLPTLALVLAALALVLAPAIGKDAPPAFAHAIHLKNGVGCPDCHKMIPSDRGVLRVLPGRAVCLPCHKDSTWPTAVPKGERGVTFVHSGHQDAIKDCAACHKDPDAKAGKATWHAACATCHQSAYDELQCGLCHGATPFTAQNALNDFTHKDRFLAEHGPYATRSAQTCRQCHTESWCNDCHGKRAQPRPSIKYPEAVTRNLIHRGDWVTLHPAEARTDDSKCLSCHARKDCNACHARNSVGPAADHPTFTHPASWLANHGKQAREDITRCASCHEQTGFGNCVACHKASGPTPINPHPKGWESRVHGMSQHQGMCAKCHDK